MKSWEYGKDLFACFVELEKAYDRIPRDKLWNVLQEYGVDGQLLRAIKSFYCRPEVCVRVNGKQSKPFHVGVVLRRGCVLSSSSWKKEVVFVAQSCLMCIAVFY